MARVLPAANQVEPGVRYFDPLVAYFDQRVGRPSTPMETYLRIMFLKFRYHLGYESLCREVSDSITPGGGSAGSRWMAACRTRRR